MSFQIKIHYDNHPGFHEPHIWIWSVGSAIQGDFPPTGQDAFGLVYDISDQPPDFTVKPKFSFKFKDGPGTAGPWEDSSLNRDHRWFHLQMANTLIRPAVVVCGRPPVANKSSGYTVLK